MAIKVAINGYGNIGKRVADAVAKQDDMELVGVAKTRPNFEAFVANKKGYPIYASGEDKIAAFDAAGLEVAGTKWICWVKPTLWLMPRRKGWVRKIWKEYTRSLELRPYLRVGRNTMP